MSCPCRVFSGEIKPSDYNMGLGAIAQTNKPAGRSEDTMLNQVVCIKALVVTSLPGKNCGHRSPGRAISRNGCSFPGPVQALGFPNGSSS